MLQFIANVLLYVSLVYPFDDSEEDDLDVLIGHAAPFGDSSEDTDVHPPDDDDDDNHTIPVTSTALGFQPYPSNDTRSTMPSWLPEDYQNTCEQLRAEMGRNASGRPSCYDAGQFTIQPKRPIFATQRTYQVSPQQFYCPHYFVWLPHLFGRIPCPDCKERGRVARDGLQVFLRLLGWPRGPRRVVDIEHNVFVIGYRYYCGHAECGKTYQSWSPKILGIIPPPLACEFPFHLTSRNGLTDTLVGLLRSAFQRGIGPVPFAEMLRVLHVRRYEKLYTEYLETVQTRATAVRAGLLARHERFRDWNDVHGYAGYVPSAKFFRNFYDALVESRASEMDQHTAMLSARVLCIDHSHKVCRHSFRYKHSCLSTTGSETSWQSQWRSCICGFAYSCQRIRRVPVHNTDTNQGARPIHAGAIPNTSFATQIWARRCGDCIYR